MSGNIKLNTPSAGSVTISTPDTASAVTVTIPAATDTVTLNTQAQTLTNKTLTSPTITGGTVPATSGPDSTQLAGNRNKIINGAMMIDQRNAGASVTNTAGNVYSLDRWDCYGSQASKFTMQQNAGSVTPPVGFINYLGITSSSAYTATGTDEFLCRQKIEGLNCSDLAWGTANAQTVTLSFWVRSSLTGNFGGNISNSPLNRCYPFTYAISSANTWTKITLTVAGDTTGTWLTTNGIGIYVQFGLGSGSTYGSGTAGAWTGTYSDVPTGSTSVVGTNGATWYVTGVQLEKGATATPFENRLYGTELALCQRYCWNMNYAQGQAYVRFPVGFNTSTTVVVIGGIALPVTMRTNPTLTWSGGIQDLYGSLGATGNSVVIGSDTSNGSMVTIIGTYNSNTVTSGVAASFRINNSTTWYAIFTAEL